MKGESPLLSSHQNKKTSEIQQQRLFRLKIRRTDLLSSENDIKLLYERQRYATRGLYAVYIYTKLSLSLCVCVSLSRSCARIHGVFFIPSFCALLFPTMMICFGLVVLFFKAMRWFLCSSLFKRVEIIFQRQIRLQNSTICSSI